MVKYKFQNIAEMVRNHFLNNSTKNDRQQIGKERATVSEITGHVLQINKVNNTMKFFRLLRKTLLSFIVILLISYYFKQFNVL